MRSAVTGAVFALAWLALPRGAHAVTLTWGMSGTGGAGTWTNANAWWDGSQQTWNSATPDDAVFAGTGGAVTLAGGTTTVGGITFNTFTGSYTIGTASQTLVINSGITMNSGAGAVTIQNSPITLGAAQSWTNNSSSLLTVSSGITTGGNLLSVDGSGNTTLSGSIAGAGGITKTGNGRLMLSGVNTTYSGTTTVNGGLLTSNTATTGVGLSSFGTGPIVIGSSGTVQMTGSSGATNLSTYPQYFTSGYTNTVSGSGTLQLLGQNSSFSVNYSGDLSGFTGTVSATAGAGTYVGYGSSTNASLNSTGSNAKFVVSGAGAFLGVLGATGTLALGELSGNGTIIANLNNATTWEIGGLSTSSTFSGLIQNHPSNSRLSSLRKVGSGTLTLSGSNSYTGATTVVEGVLRLDSETALSAGTGVNVAGGVLDMQSLNETVGSVTLTSGSIIGTGTLTAATYSLGGGSVGVPLGAGTLNVTGNSTLNTTAAATTVNLNSGTLTLGSGGRFTSSSVAVTGGGGLVLGGNETFGSLAGAASIALGSNTLSVGGLNTSGTYSGIMSGPGNLTKTGTGTLTLSGVNTFSGTTTINNGVLASPDNSGALVRLSSFGTSAIAIGSSGTLQLTGYNGGANSGLYLNYYGSGYTNTVSGSGTLRLVGQGSGASVNYSGDLSGFTGTVSATAAAGTYVGYGSSTTPSLNTTGSSAKFVVSGAGQFLGVLGATGTIALGELSGNLPIRANLTYNTTWEIGGLSTSSTFSGGFTNNTTGILSLRKVGSGTLTLSGSSAFTGGTQLLAGGLTLGNANALGAAAGPLAVTGGTLDLAGQSITVGLFTGSAGGTITSSTAGAMTFTANSASSGTYGGSITDGLGTVAFAKAGSGTLTLSGSNTYTGATTISAGVLQVGNGGTTGSLADSTAVSVSSGAALAFSRSDALTYGGTVSGAGALTKLGSGTLSLSGSNSYTGGTQINAGVLALGGADAIGSSGTISFGGGTLQFSSGNTTDYSSRFSTAANQAFALDTNGQNVTLATGLASTGGSLTKLGSGTLSLSGSNSYTGATTVVGGVLQIGTGGTTGSLATTGNASVASGATLAFNRSDALTYGGTVSGAGGLVKLGSNTLTLSAANTFAGGVTINDGLVIGSSRSSFGTGTIALGASASARLTAAASGVSTHPLPAYYSNGYTNAVSGSGVVQLVSGATTYSVNYSGDLSSFTGTVSATTASGQFTGIGNTTSPDLNLTGSNTKFLVTGAGTFLAVLTSSGTIVMGELSGDGTITASNSASAGLNTTWQIGSLATSSTYSGRFLDNNQGKSILAKVGSGTFTLSGSSTFTGGTQLNAGTLVVGHAAALGTGTVTLGGGLLQSGVTGTVAAPIAIAVASGTFDSQSNANTLSGVISGTGSFVKVGSGTLTLSGNNTFTGTTRIGAGTLTVGSASALSASTLDMNAADSGTVTFSQNSTLGGLTGSRGLDMGTRTLSIGNNGQSTTYSGVLSNGGLTKVGSGTLTLTGSNAYAGNTTISAGRLALTGNGVLNSGSYAGAIALTNPAELFVGSDANQILSGVISGTGSLTKDGAGTLAVPAINSYSGTTTVNAGLLTTSSNAGAAVRVSSFGLSQIVIGASGTVQLTGWNVQGLNSVNAYYLSGYTNTVSGSGTLQLVGQASSFSVNYSGNLSAFAGTLSATAAANTYVGYGNSSIPSVNATGSNTRFVVSGAGTFLGVLGTTGTLAFGELSGNGSIMSARTYDTTWEIGALSTSSTFSGGIADNGGVPGKSSIRKVGNGTLTLSGSNSYTGLTAVDAGTLRLNATSALRNGSPVTVTNGTLDVNVAQSAGLVTLSGTGTILGASALTGTSFAVTTATGVSTISGTLAGSNAPLVKTGAGGLALTANNTFTGTATIGEGFVTISSLPNRGVASPLGSGTTIALGASTTTGTLRYTGSGETTNRLFVLSGSTGGGVIEANGSGPLSLTGTVNAAAGNKLLTLAGSNTGNNSIGPINDAPTSGGVTSLVKTGAGRWVLSGPGDYTGSTTVDEGELLLAANAAGSGSGALGANTLAAITIGSATGSGTAALLLNAGVTVDSRAFTIPGGTQATVIGALGSGTATFASTGSPSITFGRDFMLRAATGGTLVMNNPWAQSSGTSVNVTVGGIGNEGTVVLGRSLGATGTVRIDRGMLTLAPSGAFGGSLADAAGVVVGPAGSVGAILNVRDLNAAYSFGAGQTLSGIGTLQLDADSPVSIAGLFSPGNSPGLFTFDGGGTTTLSGTTLMEMVGTSRGVTGGYDAVDLVNGSSLVLGGALELWFGNAFPDDTTFNLFTLTGTGLSGNFTGVTVSGSSAAYTGLTWSQNGSVWNSSSTEAGQSLRFNSADGTLVVVPEPATLALAAIGIGLGGWAAVRRRK